MLNVLAVLPALYLMNYIYKHDKIEKEPISLLAVVFVFGMISTIPTVVVELILEGVLGIFLDEDSGLYKFLSMFFAVAMVEEYWKRWAAKRAWNHPEFNYRFDAIVYCVTAALGFAALENILYVMEGGLSVAVLRALTAVPSHAIDGVIMGIFFGEAKFREQIGDFRGKQMCWKMSLLIPMLAHGFYDYCLVSGGTFAGIIFILFVVGIDVWAVRYIKRASVEDEMI